jgi:hypothetical protein
MRTRWQVTTAAVLVSGVLALGSAAPAFAQPVAPVTQAVKDQARRNYKTAEAKFSDGNYAIALGYYEQAEATVPVPATKYKIAVCHDKLGQTKEALRWYQAFLDASPPVKMAAAVADATARIAALRGAGPAGVVRIAVAPANAPRMSFSIDGGPMQPGAPSVSLPPGHHRIVVQADGFAPAATELDLASAETKDVRIALGPALAPAPAPTPGVVVVAPPPTGVAVVPGPQPLPYEPPPQRRRSNVPAYVMFGLTGVSVIVEAAFGAMALTDKSNFNAHPTSSGADKTQRDGLISDVALGAAVAFAVTGVVLLVTNRAPAPQTTGAVHGFFTPYAAPTGAGAVGGFTF